MAAVARAVDRSGSLTRAPAVTTADSRTRIRRVVGQGAYDRPRLNTILMACWRDGDYLYVHGAQGFAVRPSIVLYDLRARPPAVQAVA